MDFLKFTRRPFTVEAVEITAENIGELAELVGDVREPEDGGDPYIALDRRIVPNMRKAYIGWWVTRMDDNLRCYAPQIFTEQFEEVYETISLNDLKEKIDTEGVLIISNEGAIDMGLPEGDFTG